MSIVSVENIRHSYGDHKALDGVSFEVQRGSCFGLLGPNGSGKSTLFKILTTLLPPSSGRAVVAGHDASTARSQVRQSIGVVFQSPSLDIYLTVRENLLHAGHLYGLTGTALASRIDEVMGALKLSDRANSRVKTLSGGLKRRVEIAKCLLHHPALLILDEPSTGLDPLARKELWQHLKSLQKDRGMSILVTTHFMDEAERCDRLAIFDRGRLVALGTPDELKHRIGGECVTIEADDPATLAVEIESLLNRKTTQFDGSLRLETPDGVGVMSRLMSTFGPRIRSITLGKPTLEDVFVHETGRRFEEAEAAGV